VLLTARAESHSDPICGYRGQPAGSSHWNTLPNSIRQHALIAEFSFDTQEMRL
jgi:hypothetical protein